MKKNCLIVLLFTCLHGGLHTMEHSTKRRRISPHAQDLYRQALQQNDRYCNPTTALFKAAEKGYAEIVDDLIAHGADLTARDECGRTPLHVAAGSCYSNVQTLERILVHKPDVNTKCKALNMPLYNAVAWPERVQLLLQYGAEVDTQQRAFGGILKGTPLSHVIALGYLESLKLLLVANHARSEERRMFPFNLFATRKVPHESQERITLLQCLCTFAKARGRSDWLHSFSNERSLPPLPPLPVPLQDLIISYLPEDIVSPRLLARVCKHLYTTHPERITSLVAHMPRTFFVAALQQVADGPMKQVVVDQLANLAIRNANNLCALEHAHQKKWPEGYWRYRPGNEDKLDCDHEEIKQLIIPEDPYGVRAAFIHQQIKKICTKD